MDGVIVECGLAAAPDPEEELVAPELPDAPISLDFDPEAPELLISLDLVLLAPDEPELEVLLVPILPQAARAITHAKGMIQFFMKNSLKERKENGIGKRHSHFYAAVTCMTGALNRKIPEKEVPNSLYKKA